MAVKTVHDTLKSTPLFRMGVWLALCLALVVAAWRRRETPSGAFAVAVCGSAAVYVLTYWPVGVSVDFRYGYWAVLAALAGAAVYAARPAHRTDRPSSVSSAASFAIEHVATGISRTVGVAWNSSGHRRPADSSLVVSSIFALLGRRKK